MSLPEESTSTGDPVSRPDRLVLHVLGGTILASHPLPPVGHLTIGRTADCDLCIDHASISRRHAILHLGATFLIEDLNSKNGTSVRDMGLVPGTAVAIALGEPIQLGEITVVVQRSHATQRPRRLCSHDYFEERLEDECARAERGEIHFAIAHLRVSDDPGRRVVESILAQVLRSGDVVALYGPEVCEVLLVDTSAEEAEQIIEVITRLIRERGVDLSRKGIACFPRDGRTAEALLAKVAGEPPGDADDHGPLVVISPAMQRLHQLIERVAPSQINVLILGETGVGKEVAAEALHRRSPRGEHPLLRLNCAALSETLLESELFGHERGAFTGAVKTKPGLLEIARGGTVFLDEVGELPQSIQAKLLRVIDERMVLRVGGLQPRPIDVRFVAATNRDLELEISAGKFRQDLYYRLCGIAISIPPLRERREEIAPLARQFASRVQVAGQRAPTIDGEAMRMLEAHQWPGNIRELRNVIERAVLLAGPETISPLHLPQEKMKARYLETIAPTPIPGEVRMPGEGPSANGPVLRSQLRALEQERIEEALARCGGNQTEAAKLLGMARRTFISRLNAYGIRRPRKPTSGTPGQ